MSYTYAGYHHRQGDIPQPYQQTCNYLNGADPYAQPHYCTRQQFQFDRYDMPYDQPECQFPFQPNAYQPDGHQQRHPYQFRQPTSWDPPWLRQTTAYQQPSSHELDLSSPPPPSCWDPPWLRTHQEYSPYDQPIQRQPLGPQQFDQPPAHRVSCWEPSLTATVAVYQPHQHYQHPRSDLPLQQTSPAQPLTAPLLASPLLPTAAVVPPLNMSPLAPPCSPDINEEEGELLEKIPPPRVISPPCVLNVSGEEEVPNVSREEEAVFDSEKEVDSVEEVKTVITSFNVTRVASQDVDNCLYALDGNKVADAFSIRLKEIVFLYKDLHGGDVARMNHRSTLLDGDARLIPPRNDTPCLGVLGCVDELSTLALNFDNHIGLPLMIFDGDDKGRRFFIRCAFDPGGNSSPKLLFATLFVVSWFPP